MQLKINS